MVKTGDIAVLVAAGALGLAAVSFFKKEVPAVSGGGGGGFALSDISDLFAGLSTSQFPAFSLQFPMGGGGGTTLIKEIIDKGQQTVTDILPDGTDWSTFDIFGGGGVNTPFGPMFASAWDAFQAQAKAIKENVKEIDLLKNMGLPATVGAGTLPFGIGEFSAGGAAFIGGGGEFLQETAAGTPGFISGIIAAPFSGVSQGFLTLFRDTPIAIAKGIQAQTFGEGRGPFEAIGDFFAGLGASTAGVTQFRERAASSIVDTQTANFYRGIAGTPLSGFFQATRTTTTAQGGSFSLGGGTGGPVSTGKAGGMGNVPKLPSGWSAGPIPGSYVSPGGAGYSTANVNKLAASFNTKQATKSTAKYFTSYGAKFFGGGGS